MKRPLLTFACALAVAMPAMAQDDPPIGSRLGSRLKPVEVQDEKAAALGAHELARCMVARNGREVRKILADVDPDAIQKLNSSSSGNLICFNAMLSTNHLVEGRRISYPQGVMRGMLAEYLVKADRASYQQLPPLPRQKTYKRPWFAATSRPVVVDEMATCVAEVQPAGVLTALDTEPYSDGERQAFAMLAPVMGPCLSAGTKLTANRQALRAAVAEALYQRTQPWLIATGPHQETAK